MASEGGGKVKTKRNAESRKPYERRKSLMNKVTDKVKGIFSPTWLVDLVGISKTKTTPSPVPSHSSSNNYSQEGGYTPPDCQQISNSPVFSSYNSFVPNPARVEQQNQIAPACALASATVSTAIPTAGNFQPLRAGNTRPVTLHTGNTRPASGNVIPAVSNMRTVMSNSALPDPSSSMPVVMFTSDNLPFSGYKKEMSSSMVVNGGDDQSELSDFSVSTSGCSSMVPNPDRRALRKSAVSGSRIEQLRQELGGSVTPRKELEACMLGQQNAGVNKTNEKSFMWSAQKQQPSKPQTPASTDKPQFNVSLFGSPATAEDSSVFLGMGYKESPYYPGKTTFGGASAHRRSRLQQVAPYEKKQVKAKPLLSQTLGGVTSSAAKKILDTLDRMSTPIKDAKKIPPLNSSLMDSPLSFTPSSFRRRSLPARHLGNRNITEGPPTQTLATPTIASVKRPQITHKLPVRTRHSTALSDQQSHDSTKPQDEVLFPSERTNRESTYSQTSRSRKMKTEKSKHYTSKTNQEDTEEVPDLPTGFTLPITSIPSFSFTSQAPSTSAQNSGKFTFSSPIEKSSLATSQVVSDASQSFSFRSPIPVEKRNGHAASTSTIVSVPSLTFQTQAPSVAKPKKRLSEDSAQPVMTSAVKAATVLKTGSVMDILGKPAAKPVIDVSGGSGIKTTQSPKFGEILAAANKEEGGRDHPSITEPKQTQSLSELFKKAEGSWECPTCMIVNKPDVSKCPACDTHKPSAKPPEQTASAAFVPAPDSGPSLSELFKKPTGSWDCPTCMIQNKSDVTKCPACDTAKPGKAPPQPQSIVASTMSTKPSISEMFKKPQGSWECETCMVSNTAENTKCVCCETLRPGATAATTSFKSSGGFKMAPTGGLTFGTAPASSSVSSAFTGGFKFGQTATETIPEKPTVDIKFGQTEASSAKAQAVSQGGFKFGPTVLDSDASGTKATDSGEKSKDTTSSGLSFDPTVKSSKIDSPATKSLASSGGFQFGTSSFKNESVAGGTEQSKDTADTSTKPAVQFGQTTDTTKASGFHFGQQESNKSVSSPSSGFKFGQSHEEKQTVKPVSSEKTKQEVKGGIPAGFSFGQSSAKPATERKTVAGGFGFGGNAAVGSLTSTSAGPTAAVSVTPTAVFGAATSKPLDSGTSFSFGTGQTAKTATVFGSQDTIKKSETFSATSSATFNFSASQSSGGTTVSGPTSAGLFTFGKSTEPAKTPAFSFKKPDDSTPSFSFGQSASSDKSSGQPAPASLFVFGKTPEQTTSISSTQMFGKRSAASMDPKPSSPTKKGKSESGSIAGPSVFGSSTTVGQSVFQAPQMGTGSVFGTANAAPAPAPNFQMPAVTATSSTNFAATPSFNFGSQQQQPASSVFQFSSSAQQKPETAVNSSSTTPAFGATPSSQPAPAFNFTPTPSFNFTGQGPQTSTPFQFSATPTTGATTPSMRRPVKKALRKLRK